MALSDTDLVCRYYFDEATSGTSPTEVADASGNGYDLTTINYGSGNLAWTEVSGESGLESTSTTGSQRAVRGIVTSDALLTALNGVTKATLELVVRVDSISASTGRIFAINDTSGGVPRLGFGGISTSQMRPYWNGRTGEDLNLGTGTNVVHVVFDTTLATADQRYRIYVNGALADNLGSGSGEATQNETLSIANGQELIAFNRQSSGSYDRSFDGVLFYAAIYADAFDATRCDDHYDVLTLDDDTPAGGSPATLSSPTPSGTLGTATTATIGATTDQTTGTLYAVVDSAANLTGVTATQVIAGQKASGAAALAAGSGAVSTTTPTAGVTGLSASTLYSYAAAQSNANGASNVVTGTFTTADPPVSLEQSRFRFRNDDGSETTATWAAAENAGIAVAALTPKRLRVQVAATSNPAATAFKLQYRKRIATSALTFPSNGVANSDIRLEWDGAALLPRKSHTVIWRARYVQQLGYYAVAWHTSNDGTWKASDYEYGTHPYPTTGTVDSAGRSTGGTGSIGAVHYFEIAGLSANDYIASPGPGTTTLVVKDQWYTQARTCEVVNISGTDYVRHTFWPDISVPAVYIRQDILKSLVDADESAAVSPAFIFGCSPWTVSGSTNNETPSGDFYGLKFFDVALSIADITSEDAAQSNSAATSAGIASLFYANVSPTPSDVSDKSGNGNDPTWANSNRPTLLTLASEPEWKDVN